MSEPGNNTVQPSRYIASQMALGFGSVSLIAVAMSVALIAIIYSVSSMVVGMRHEEDSIASGLQLSTTIQEYSTQVAYLLADPSAEKQKRYQELKQDIQSQNHQLALRVPETERWRLKEIDTQIQTLDRSLLVGRLDELPDPGSTAFYSLIREVETAANEIATHAEVLAHSTTSKMATAHVQTIDRTRIGLAIGGLSTALIVLLSILFTIRLRGALLRPLVKLSNAAKHFGQGDFQYRVGELGKGELSELGGTFNHMAEELLEREQRLVKNERMAAIGQLAAGIAHELNNPIGIMRGYLKTMNPDGDSKLLKEELAIVDEEASYCQRIASDLLEYARIEEVHFEFIDIGELVENTVLRFRDGPESGQTKLVSDVEKDHIRADSSRLRQVVLNLLSNANHHAPTGSEIMIRGKVSKQSYSIEIEDEGPGISPEFGDKIFEPFFSKRRGGSGLGLAVCMGIVRAHRGTIDHRPAPSGGSIFRVTLPRKHPSQTMDSFEEGGQR